MITFLTGLPGGGKTLLTVSKLLMPLIGATETWENEDGEMVTTKRVIYTNIRGLLLDHEFIDYERASKWHEWCKPGDVIVLDECQKLFVRRPNGAKVPDYVHELEEHRGKHSVDFILITQHPMLIDGHVQNLVGRHLHLRRVANMNLSVVYEWDSCSKTLLYKNAITKSPWRFDKKAMQLYKSARAHTKQPRKIPGLVWFILAGFCGAAYAFPTLKDRLSERITGKPAQVAQSDAAPGQKSEYVKDGIKYTVETTTTQVSPLPLPTASSPLQASAMLAAGCIATVAQGCKCFDQVGKKVDSDPAMCPSTTAKPGEDLQYIRETPALVAPSQQQPELISFGGTARGVIN